MTIYLIIGIYKSFVGENDIKENLFAFETLEEAKETLLNLKKFDEVHNVESIKGYEIEEIPLY